MGLIEDLVKFSHKYKDEDYITIEIAKLKSPDKFGHDYTAYVNRLEETEVKEPVKPVETPKKKRNTSKKASKEVPSGDLPFWFNTENLKEAARWAASFFDLLPPRTITQNLQQS